MLEFLLEHKHYIDTRHSWLFYLASWNNSTLSLVSLQENRKTLSSITYPTSIQAI
jgi:hypothetical protein